MTSNAKRFSANLSKLARDIDELRKDCHGLNEHDRLCSEQTVLKQKLQQNALETARKDQESGNLHRAKDELITSLRADIKQLKIDEEVLTRKYHTQFKAWDTEKHRHSKESEVLSRMQNESQHWKRQADNAASDLEELRHEFENKVQDVTNHQSTITQLQRQLTVNSIRMEEAVEKQSRCAKDLAKVNEELGIMAIDQEQRFVIS